MSDIDVRLIAWELTQGPLRATLRHQTDVQWRITIDPSDHPVPYEGTAFNFGFPLSDTAHLKALEIAGRLLETESQFVLALEYAFSTRTKALEALYAEDYGSPESA